MWLVCFYRAMRCWRNDLNMLFPLFLAASFWIEKSVIFLWVVIIAVTDDVSLGAGLGLLWILEVFTIWLGHILMWLASMTLRALILPIPTVIDLKIITGLQIIWATLDMSLRIWELIFWVLAARNFLLTRVTAAPDCLLKDTYDIEVFLIKQNTLLL